VVVDSAGEVSLIFAAAILAGQAGKTVEIEFNFTVTDDAQGELVNVISVFVTPLGGVEPDEPEVVIETSLDEPDRTLTYSLNGGVGAVPVDSNSPYASRSVVTVLGTAITRAGYRFVGWSEDSLGLLGVAGAAGVMQAGETFVISRNTTLYAVWLPLTGSLSMTSSIGGVSGYVPGSVLGYSMSAMLPASLAETQGMRVAQTYPAGMMEFTSGAAGVMVSVDGVLLAATDYVVSVVDLGGGLSEVSVSLTDAALATLAAAGKAGTELKVTLGYQVRATATGDLHSSAYLYVTPKGGSEYASAETSASLITPELYSYLLTVLSGSGSGGYPEGALVNVVATVPPSYLIFKEWTGSAADTGLLDDATAASAWLVMPGRAVALTATYKSNPADASVIDIGGKETRDITGDDGDGTAAKPKVLEVTTDGRDDKFDHGDVTVPDGATVRIFRDAGYSDEVIAPDEIDLVAGQVNYIYVMVTSADGSSTIYYRLEIYRPVPKYVLNVVGGVIGAFGGSGGSGVTTGAYEAGEEIAITANPAADGFVFDQWVVSVSGGGAVGGAWSGGALFVVDASSTTLTMPAADVTVTATYKVAVLYIVIEHFGTFKGTGVHEATIDAPFTEFIRLELAGGVVGPSNYSVRFGSVIITLSEGYLKTLSNGNYWFRAYFKNGYADIYLTVNVTSGGGVGGGGGQTGVRVPGTGDILGVAAGSSVVASFFLGEGLIFLWIYQRFVRKAKAPRKRK
jgi:hypothetical protein